MANLQNRTRVVYVRVSEEEFRQFRGLCEQHGARNMSDFVRSAINLMLHQQGNGFEHSVMQRLQQLEDSVNNLKAQITAERPA
jgi:hypothetical protein